MSELNEELLEDESDDLGEIGELDEEALLQEDDEALPQDVDDDDDDCLNLESEETMVTENKNASDNEDTGGSRLDKFAIERQQITAPSPSQDDASKVKDTVSRQNFRGRGRGRSGFRQQRFHSYQEGPRQKFNHFNNNWPRGRGKTVLINPRFQGTVSVRDNARLAWDSQPNSWANPRQQGNMEFPMQGPPRMSFPPMGQYPNPPIQGPNPMYMMPPQRPPVNHSLTVNQGPLNPGNMGPPLQQPFFNMNQQSFIPGMPVSQVQGQQFDWYSSNPPPPPVGGVNNFHQPSNPHLLNNNQYNSYGTPNQQIYSTVPNNNLPYKEENQMFSRHKTSVGIVQQSMTSSIQQTNGIHNEKRCVKKRLGTPRPSVMTEVTVTNVTTVQIEDPETRDLRLKIEEQKRKREQVLKWKEERRLNSLKGSGTSTNMIQQDSPPFRVIREVRGPKSNRLVQPKISLRTPVLKPVRQLVRNHFLIDNGVVPANNNQLPNEEEDSSEIPQPSSGFLADRKILVKDQSLPSTRSVRIKNIATSTGDKKIFQICKSIGDVQKLHRDKTGEATITFKSVASAHAFFKKYRRHMLDLSMIEVSLITEPRE